MKKGVEMWWIFGILVSLILIPQNGVYGLNLAPVFTQNMNQHTIKENTPIGSIIYTLKGEDYLDFYLFFSLVFFKFSEIFSEYSFFWLFLSYS